MVSSSCRSRSCEGPRPRGAPFFHHAASSSAPPAGANVPGVDAIGHVDPGGGGPINFYGLAFELAG